MYICISNVCVCIYTYIYIYTHTHTVKLYSNSKYSHMA